MTHRKIGKPLVWLGCSYLCFICVFVGAALWRDRVISAEEVSMYRRVAYAHRTAVHTKPPHPDGETWRAGNPTQELYTLTQEVLSNHPNLLALHEPFTHDQTWRVYATDHPTASGGEGDCARLGIGLQTRSHSARVLSQDACSIIHSLSAYTERLQRTLEYEHFGEMFSIWNTSLENTSDAQKRERILMSLAYVALDRGVLAWAEHGDLKRYIEAISLVWRLGEELKHGNGMEGFRNGEHLQQIVQTSMGTLLRSSVVVDENTVDYIIRHLLHGLRYPDRFPHMFQAHVLLRYGRRMHRAEVVEVPWRARVMDDSVHETSLWMKFRAMVLEDESLLTYGQVVSEREEIYPKLRSKFPQEISSYAFLDRDKRRVGIDSYTDLVTVLISSNSCMIRICADLEHWAKRSKLLRYVYEQEISSVCALRRQETSVLFVEPEDFIE